MPLHIESRQERSITVICLAGSVFNHDGASELRHSLSEWIRTGQHRIILEVDGVSGIDQAGVKTLCDMQVEAKQGGGDLKITGAPYPFLAALALHDSADTFPYYSDSEQAEMSFTEGQGNAPRAIKRFDILEFVKEQEKEDQAATEGGKSEPDAAI